MATIANVSLRMANHGFTWVGGRREPFCSSSDPIENRINHRKTYHIEAPMRYEKGDDVLRFDNLDNILLFIQAFEGALAKAHQILDEAVEYTDDVALEAERAFNSTMAIYYAQEGFCE